MVSSILSIMKSLPRRACSSADWSISLEIPCLYVHLHCSHTIARSGYLEVHVTKGVLYTLYVCEDRKIIFVFDKPPHCYSGNWFPDRNPPAVP